MPAPTSPKDTNPFSQTRAERMGDELWRLYVPLNSSSLAGKPLVLEGGRGSGKTMFFLNNSWRQQLARLRNDRKAAADLLSPPNWVGLYHKVETQFVRAMMGQDRNDWEGLFATYLSASLGKQLVLFLKQAVEDGTAQSSDLAKALSVFGDLLVPSVPSNTVEEALCAIEQVLDGVEYSIYDFDANPRPKKTLVGRTLAKVISNLRSVAGFERTVYRIYIDEYENLLDYQQRLVNLLIKHSDFEVIYSVGMRPYGMRTTETAQKGEHLQYPDDYQRVRIEELVDTGTGGNQSRYQDLLLKVCEKRLEMFNSVSGRPPIPTDIRFYLGEYSINEEVGAYENSGRTPKFRERLAQLIRDQEEDPQVAREAVELLATDAPLMNARLHLALLLREERYRPSVRELIALYRAWSAKRVIWSAMNDGAAEETEEDSAEDVSQADAGEEARAAKYEHWYHNAKLGIVFLLARDYHSRKQYFGFDTFAMLSSGIIRFFLELCEQAIEFAMLNDFSWEHVRKITPDEQTKAARFVSGYRMNEIIAFGSYGKHLRTFVFRFGQALSGLHGDANSTLGEPEINHFSTNDQKLSAAAKTVLDRAIMYQVLQERRSTKEKRVMPDALIDYHLNHIFCPYFDISYRQKRKLTIPPTQVEDLLSGDDIRAANAAKALLRGSEGRAAVQLRFDSPEYPVGEGMR